MRKCCVYFHLNRKSEKFQFRGQHHLNTCIMLQGFVSKLYNYEVLTKQDFSFHEYCARTPIRYETRFELSHPRCLKIIQTI